ncbi:MAG: DNA-processing protein DprA [Patescibacteria group bacterium]|nr:DNA-processing protein DprA [Patescibacteria group bacterium]MDE2116536.1 DNA-processing protein DprA [Patescibacteria group bacterium]
MNSIDYPIHTIESEHFPRLLREALDGSVYKPDRLYVRGAMPAEGSTIFLAVVGSRRCTEYGAAACKELIAGLRGLSVVIISGLAYGIDSIAHEAALENGLTTIAVPGSGLADDMIYPAAHIGLARRILAAGGALVSPFAETIMGNNWTFPVRNGIMAGLAHATLVVEAAEGSGTLITAQHAANLGRDVFVVPGQIFSKRSTGSNKLISDGASPVLSSRDLAERLGFDADAPRSDEKLALSEDERQVFKVLEEPISREEACRRSGLDAARFAGAVSALEMKGLLEGAAGALRRRRI